MNGYSSSFLDVTFLLVFALSVLMGEAVESGDTRTSPPDKGVPVTTAPEETPRPSQGGLLRIYLRGGAAHIGGPQGDRVGADQLAERATGRECRVEYDGATSAVDLMATVDVLRRHAHSTVVAPVHGGDRSGGAR